MRIEFSGEEVESFIKAVYLAKFGPLPDGYEMNVTRKYSYSNEVEVDVFPTPSRQKVDDEVAS
jgi:hypothetical protein